MDPINHPRIIKHIAIRMGAWLLLLACMGVAGAWFFPLRVRQFQDSMETRRLGLRPIRSSLGHAGYERGESTRCVVWIHGSGDAARTWFRVLPMIFEAPTPGGVRNPLSIHRHVFWELPGHGSSRAPEPTVGGTRRLGPRAMAEELYEATREAGCLGKSIWVGNSLGGWVAAWAGLLHPEGIQGLVLLAPAGLLSQSRHPLTPDLSRLLANPTVESLQEFRNLAYARPRPTPGGWASRLISIWGWQAAVKAVRASSVARIREATLPEDYLDASLGLLRVPTLVVWGRQDRILPLEASQDFLRLAPASISNFREVDACGHLPQKECPEAVRTALVDILHFGAF